MLVIVPNDLRDAINVKLDAALADMPDAERDRDALYQQILAHFNERGVIPDFSIVPKEDSVILGKLK